MSDDAQAVARNTPTMTDEPPSPPMRIAVVGVSHETNTFCVEPTTLAGFDAEGILRGGDEIIAVHRTAHTILSGFLEAGEQHADVMLEPLYHAPALPSGTIDTATFERVAGEMVAAVRDGGPWAGVLMAQHGAAVAAGVAAADGEMVARMRSCVGPDVPIGVVLDMHANVSRQLVDAATVVTIYRTNPHVDPRDRGRECAELLFDTIRGRIRPAQGLCQVPAAIDITRQATAEQPMRALMEAVADVARLPGVLSASLAQGYPYADVPEMGMSCLVISDDDADAASRLADELGRRVWSSRDAFTVQASSPDAALEAASQVSGPALVLDVGDNIGGGGPGDSTVLLAAARRLGVRDVLFIIVDPQAVATAMAAGAGAILELEVGGHIDARWCAPVNIRGRFVTSSNGRYEEPGATHGGYRFFDAGPTVVVETTDGHTVILVSRAQLPSSLEQIRSLGLSPEGFSILTAKGVISPRAGYEQVTRATFVADTPGVTAADVNRFGYQMRRHPMYPFEADMEWSPGRP